MSKKIKKILMESIIHDDETKFITTLNIFDLVLDETYFDYELLKVALDKGRGNVANILISKGCRIRNPNKINLEASFSYETPLHLAVKLEDMSVIFTMLNKGASIYDKNLQGDTPLYTAFRERCYRAESAILDYISNSDLDFNPDNKDDVLHFHIACIRKHVDSIKRFLSLGFDVNSYLSVDSAEFSGLTPLHYLISKNYCGELFQILLKHSDLTVKNSNGLTPLHSIYYNCVEKYDDTNDIYYSSNFCKIITQVFEFGKDTKFINAVDNYGASHFHLCCSIDRPDFVQVFIDSGADVNSTVSLNCSANPGFTPLHFAAKNSCVRVVELLLKNGADCSRTDKKGASPLYLACSDYMKEGAIKIIEMLLDYSACLAVTDDCGNTTIHLMFDKLWMLYYQISIKSAKRSNLGQVICILDKLLSKVPLKVNLTNNNGLSIFHIICTRNFPHQVNELLNSGTAIDSCVLSGRFKGYTALHFAVLFNQKAVVEVLLKRNAKVNVKTEELDTPLHLACEFTEFKFYEVDSEYEKKWQSNYVPMSLNLMHTRKSQLAIIKLLLLHGAEVDAKNVNRETPLLTVYSLPATVRSWIDEYSPDAYYEDILNEIDTRMIKITKILPFKKGNVIRSRKKSRHTIFHSISCSTVRLKVSDELMECLLTAGADINAVDGRGLTPLHYAAQLAKDELVQIFIKYKANVNAECKFWFHTPLQNAMSTYISFEHKVRNEEIKLRKSSQSCVKIILENSEINKRLACGGTLLHYTVFSHNIFLTETLLYYGADINLEDAVGNSPVCFLLKKKEINDNVINVSCIIFIHVQRLLALGLCVNDKVQKFCNYFRQYYKTLISETKYNRICNVFNECIDELNRMKIKKIDKYSFLYDVLLKNPHELSINVRNSTLIKILERQDIDVIFPLYSYLLKVQYKRGLLRSNALKEAKSSLISVTSSNLPDECYDSILRYLTNEEFFNLNAAAAGKAKKN